MGPMTTIAVRSETKLRLDGRKRVARETYDEVLTRLLDDAGA